MPRRGPVAPPPVGFRCHRLRVVGEAVFDGVWKCPCACDCGQTKLVTSSELKNLLVQSCGCRRKEFCRERFTRHGHKKHPLTSIWSAMRDRCGNTRYHGYHRYGGRGITVCSEWNEFQVFFEWAMRSGYQKGLELDRRDVNAGYSPDNCRWVTRQTNQNNRRNNLVLTAWGESKSVADWSRDSRCRVRPWNIYDRVHRGWSHEEAICTPPMRGKRKVGGDE
jgi:hypothetical protein